MRHAAWLATALAGCLVPNPLYDSPADTASGSGAGSTSAAASTGAGPPDGSSGGSGGASSTSGSIGETTTTTITPTTTGSTGGVTATGSTTNCDACGECEACEAGQCVPKAGSACEAGTDLPCEQRIWGFVSEGCAVMKKSDAAVCDGAGVCRWQCEDAPGAVPFKCDELCRVGPGKCVNGEDVAKVESSDVCVKGEPTSDCGDKCVEIANDIFVVEPRACDKDGKCKAMGIAKPCGNYTCKPNGKACEVSCDSDAQCAGDSDCHEMSGTCVDG